MDWKQTVNDLGPRLFRYFAATFPSFAAADLVQETLIRVVQKVRQKKFDPQKGSIVAYSYGIAHFVRLEALKSASRNRVFCETHPDRLDPSDHVEVESQEDEIGRKDELLMLRNAVGKLPEREQDVLMLLIDRELSLQEIANILKMPLGTVKSHVHRAKKNLKEILIDQRGLHHG